MWRGARHLALISVSAMRRSATGQCADPADLPGRHPAVAGQLRWLAQRIRVGPARMTMVLSSRRPARTHTGETASAGGWHGYGLACVGQAIVTELDPARSGHAKGPLPI